MRILLAMMFLVGCANKPEVYEKCYTEIKLTMLGTVVGQQEIELYNCQVVDDVRVKVEKGGKTSKLAIGEVYLKQNGKKVYLGE